MFETDPLLLAQFAHDAVAIVGPPGGLPAPVPDFVGNILGEIGGSAGDAADGLGETISGLTPGAENAGN